MNVATSDRIAVIIEEARNAAADLQKVAAGKEGSTPTHSDARSFAAIAALLVTLSGEVAKIRQTHDAATAALRRIANLQIRDATELMEGASWKKVAGELQAIAQDALLKAGKGA